MVLVLVEHADGAPDELSLQALTFARAYAGAVGAPLHAVLVGDAAAAAALGAHGVARVLVAEHERLETYAPAAWGQIVVALIAEHAPRAVLAAGSERGNEVLAHAAAATELPLAANCVSATPGEPTTVTRLRWGGSLLEEARIHAPCDLLTVAPHTVTAEPADTPGAAVVQTFSVPLGEAELLVRVAERVPDNAGGVSLADAKVVVSGGRGVGSAEGFGVIEELAGLLGGAVGCSRAVTIAGWRPHTDQVGQTGTKIAPELYMPCGISGATQHMAGCKGAKRLLAINPDPEAPILTNADYAVIGDLLEVVPAISAEIRRARAT
jgi:electron transfer flavoprotein alpha subunit